MIGACVHRQYRHFAGISKPGAITARIWGTRSRRWVPTQAIARNVCETAFIVSTAPSLTPPIARRVQHPSRLRARSVLVVQVELLAFQHQIAAPGAGGAVSQRQQDPAQTTVIGTVHPPRSSPSRGYDCFTALCLPGYGESRSNQGVRLLRVEPPGHDLGRARGLHPEPGPDGGSWPKGNGGDDLCRMASNPDPAPSTVLQTEVAMPLIYDIGMYDGADTQYFLSLGAKVVAVEANPSLVAQARVSFAEALATEQLTIINAAIAEPTTAHVELTLCVEDLGSASIFGETLWGTPGDKISVPVVTLDELLEQFGTPCFLKVDIEDADRYCVLPLTAEVRPKYLSFEVARDVDELVRHAHSVGFTKIKLINQRNFREASRETRARHIVDAISRRISYRFGYSEPPYITRSGRSYAPLWSSGPAPWESDGRWCTADELLDRWDGVMRRGQGARQYSPNYDVHAM